MEKLMMLVSILLIAMVLLQSNKAESSSQIITSQGELFKERKERGAEKTITNITLILGFLFFDIAIVYNFI